MSKNRKGGNSNIVAKKYHCPTEGCLFAEGSERHFSDKKFLNQHIVKVHAEKKYICSKCQKGFGLDWWRKHHEETCGQEWLCDCGAKYFSRESLLTHARRTQHQLPDHILHFGKKKAPSVEASTKENPFIVIIQPIIQNITCIQPIQNLESSFANLRPILPKKPKPELLLLPNSLISPLHESLVVNPSPAIQQTPKSFALASSPSSLEDNCSLLKDASKLQKSTKLTPEKANLSKNGNQFQKTAAETQTTWDNRISSLKKLHSQASQCSGRAPKNKRIESTHTQTAESVVVKMKKKHLSNKSRRKSVAITTESNMLTHRNLTLQSLWPGIKDCIFQSSNISTCSTSTQTYSDMPNKVLCDSETLTDNDIFKFNWSGRKQDKDVENSSSAFKMLTADDSLTLPIVLKTVNLPEIDPFSTTNCNMNDNFTTKYKMKANTCTFSDATLENNIISDAGSIFPNVFSTNVESMTAIGEKITLPTLSDTHTQTIASSILDYNLLANNMETQTTDDFSFSDLEFSDTETQTPWDDFPNIENSPIPTDQLSIEIQTDFSSFDAGVDQDPYEFLNEMDMQNIMGAIKEPTGINIETQTYNRLQFPQLTNSESQTLEDISQFVFE